MSDLEISLMNKHTKKEIIDFWASGTGEKIYETIRKFSSLFIFPYTRQLILIEAKELIKIMENLLVIRSANTVIRIGAAACINVLPFDLCRLLAYYF
jgi:hypothetical protein